MTPSADTEARLAVTQAYLRRHRRLLLHRAQAWGILACVLLLTGFLFSSGGVAALGGFLYGGACASVLASGIESRNFVRFSRFASNYKIFRGDQHAFPPRFRP
jgi:hypothetical protein